MGLKELSLLSLSLHPDNYALYLDNPETESLSPLQLNQKAFSFSGKLSSNRHVTYTLKSSLLAQVARIQAANNEGSFSLTQLADQYNERINPLSTSNPQCARDSASNLHATLVESKGIDRDIQLLRMSAFNPPADAQSRVVLASVGAKAIQVANIIFEGTMESIGECVSTVCSIAPQTQRACNHVTERISSLATATAEFVEKQWDGSSAQREFNSAADSVKGHWQDYVEYSDRGLMLEGLSLPQIEQYKKDLAVIGHGAGTLVLTKVVAGALTSIRKSMQLLKTNTVSSLTISPQLHQTTDTLKKACAGPINNVKQSIFTSRENLAVTQTIPRNLKSKPTSSSWESVDEKHLLNRRITYRTAMVPEDIGIPTSEYLKPGKLIRRQENYNLRGTFTLNKNVLKVTLERIRVPKGRLGNWLNVMQNFKTIAQVNNANVLRFEAYFLNLKFLDVMVKRYGKPSIIVKERLMETVEYLRFDIPCATTETRLIYKLTQKQMVEGEKRNLFTSALAPAPIVKTNGLAEDLVKFYSVCEEHVIVGRKVGQHSGYIKHSLLSHTSDNHMLFFINKRPTDIGLKNRGINPIHQSSRIKPTEKLDFILKEAYTIAQNKNGVTRISYIWNSDKDAVASCLIGQGHEFVGRGCFSMGIGEKTLEHIEIKLVKPAMI